MLPHFPCRLNCLSRNLCLLIVSFLFLKMCASKGANSISYPHIPEIPTVQRGRSGSGNGTPPTKSQSEAQPPAKSVTKAKPKGPTIEKFGHTYMYVKNGVLIMSEVPPIKKDPVLSHEKKMEQMPLADR